jgi:hypothetical protein
LEQFGPCREHGDEPRPHFVALTDEARLFVQRDAENCHACNGTGSGLCPGWVNSVYVGQRHTDNLTGWYARELDPPARLVPGGTEHWGRAYRFVEFDNDAKMAEFLERLNKDVEDGMSPGDYMERSGYTCSFERVFDQDKAKLVREANAKAKVVSAWSMAENLANALAKSKPGDDKVFDGMVQLLVVPEDLRNELREKVAPFSLSPGSKNTMPATFTWHHVTWAFKPTGAELKYAQLMFGPYDSPDNCVYFVPQDVRADEEICAVFGHVEVDGVVQPGGLKHITIGGSVPPKESARLERDYVTTTSWSRFEGVPEKIGLVLNIVDF